MATELRVIHVSERTALSDVLAEAQKAPVILERDGVLYRLTMEPEALWTVEDPEFMRKWLQRFSGTLSEDEAEQLIDAVYRGREQGSRSSSRP